MAKTLLCKLLQKKTYDILAKKYTVLLLFIGIVIVIVATLHFGETMMDWSKEKYSAVFNPYNDNIAGKSFRTMLCQFVPIDVVYTWVNGTDPKHLKGLAHAKEEYGFSYSHTNCSFPLCVKSHMVFVKPHLPSTVTLNDLEEADSVFEAITETFVVSTPHGGHENITVLVFPSIDIADRAVEKKFLMLDGQNHSISMALITDNWLSESTVTLQNVFIMTDVPPEYTEEGIRENFSDNIQKVLGKVFIHADKNVVVFTVSSTDTLGPVKKLDIEFFGKTVGSAVSANLVVQLPPDHEDISASRFTDNEELRYSLRSLEKHAPWVQHIYIVTNGQIPYWLNLDNTRVTVVTHEEIFPNRSHLPTFSSPAIECHLHRIPNLSKKFLYLNDDVMFGKDVWPEDFYTHTRGQKVYLSWPVPNCAEGCPSSWIRDGYCDKPCNNSQCQWDGGDCSADNPLLSYQSIIVHQEGGNTNIFQGMTLKNYCHEECANTWLADRYCDKACNTFICGFDAGDCGVDNYDKLHQLILTETQHEYHLPQGHVVGFLNLTEFIRNNYTITEGFYDDHPVARALAISLKHSVISIVLYPHYNTTNLTVTLKGERFNQPFEKVFYLVVTTNQKIEAPKEKTKSNESHDENQTEQQIVFEEFSDDKRFPKLLPLNMNSTHYATYFKLNVSETGMLQRMKKNDELPPKLQKGAPSFFHSHSINASREIPDGNDDSLNDAKIVKKRQVTSRILKNNLIKTAEMKSNNLLQIDSVIGSEVSSKPSSPRVIPFQKSQNTLVPVASLKDYFKQLSHTPGKNGTNQFTYETPTVSNRHLLDTFGDSLRHVNKLYNDAFGYESRKVPSHIAHFVDGNVMSRLSDRFSYAFDVTSSHKIRSSNDMQFAFSYYYYLMSEMESVGVDEIFDMFDTDFSGTWSDREIRTVLTRLHELPLDFIAVNEFEQHIINCSAVLPSAASVTTPQFERYYDSKLPTVTKALVMSCFPISEMLLQQFGQRKRNKFEMVGEDEVAFKMIHNNLSQVLWQIDDLRKHPKKFVCLNDNMHHGTHEAEMIRAVIQDFYESLFPTRSQLELPPEYRNRFLYTHELKEWRKTRDLIRIATYLCLGLLIIFSVASFCKSEVRVPNNRNLVHRPQRQRQKNSYHV